MTRGELYLVQHPGCDELMSLPKAALTNHVGSLSPAKLAALDRALAFAVGLAGDRSRAPS